MALTALTELDKFKAVPFAPGYSETVRDFFAPVDQVHEVLKAVISSATKSLVVGMYGYDDDELDSIIRGKLESEKIFVSLNLDKSQAGGKHEKSILAKWLHDGVGNSIAIGHSASHHAIMHLKMIIVDGMDVITGSTNLSQSGETWQDNQLIVIRDPLFAASARTQLDIIHDDMLKQMAKPPA